MLTVNRLKLPASRSADSATNRREAADFSPRRQDRYEPASARSAMDKLPRRASPNDIGCHPYCRPLQLQVSLISERLAPRGIRVGTVDRFQGQEAPVVIYSMATSTPEDAPRGMEFLYNLNRLNVATSRARCASIVVASPRLFQPDCKSARQMRLASALCRYVELSRPVTLS